MSRTYRIYFLNDAGHIVDATTVLCETDDEAAQVAQNQDRNKLWELWNLDRLVRTYEGARSAH